MIRILVKAFKLLIQIRRQLGGLGILCGAFLLLLEGGEDA
jgi:hypothetical protein